MGRMAKLTQSDESIPLNDSFRVELAVQKNQALMKGGGGKAKGNHWGNLDMDDGRNDLFRRRCVVQMKNKDNLCVARSLCILKARAENDKAYKNLIHPLYANSMGDKGLKKRALDLQRLAGFEDDQAIDLKDLHRFETVLNAQIMVVDGRQAFHFAYIGAGSKERKFYLLKVDDHVHPIVNLQAFFKKGGFCTSCNTAYDKIHGHR